MDTDGARTFTSEDNLSDSEGELIFSEDNEAVIVASTLHNSVMMGSEDKDTIAEILRIYDEPSTKMDRFLKHQMPRQAPRQLQFPQQRPVTSPPSTPHTDGVKSKKKDSHVRTHSHEPTSSKTMSAREPRTDPLPNIQLVSASKKVQITKDQIKSEDDIAHLISMLATKKNGNGNSSPRVLNSMRKKLERTKSEGSSKGKKKEQKKKKVRKQS